MIGLSKDRIIYLGSSALLLLGLSAVPQETSVAHAALNALNNRGGTYLTLNQEEPTATPEEPAATSTPEPTATPTNNDAPTPTPQPVGFLSGRALDENGLGIQGASVTVEEPNGITATNKTNRWGEFNEYDLTGNGTYTMTLGPVVDEEGAIVQEIDDTQYVVEPMGNTEVMSVTVHADSPLGSELTLEVLDPDLVTAASAFGDAPIKTKAGKAEDGSLYVTVFQGNDVTKDDYRGARVSGVDGDVSLTADSSDFSNVTVTGSDNDGTRLIIGEGTKAITIETGSLVPGVVYDVAANLETSTGVVEEQKPDGTTETTEFSDPDGDGVLQPEEETVSQIFMPLVVAQQ